MIDFRDCEKTVRAVPTLGAVALNLPIERKAADVSLLVHSVTVLAGVVNNPAPVDPTGGSNGVNLLLSYTKWGVLIACAVVALASGGFMAIGALSHRPDNVDKGKRALIWSIIGVVASACAIPVINTVFGAAG